MTPSISQIVSVYFVSDVAKHDARKWLQKRDDQDQVTSNSSCI